MDIKENLIDIKNSLPPEVYLVAVTKTKPLEDIMQAYNTGHRVFGENKVQEIVGKWEVLPQDIQWHMIGHLQRNKVKYIAGFISLIHGVDSLRLLKEIDKQALKNGRIVDCLLQIHIAEEDSKFGLNENELQEIIASTAFKDLKNVRINGLMGMATFTEDTEQIRKEFKRLKAIYDDLRNAMPSISVLSMGMSSDYKIAVEEGSTMIRIGSSIFGTRNNNA